MATIHPATGRPVPRVALGAIREGDERFREKASAAKVNVGEVERIASAVGGGLFVAAGLRKGSFGGLALAILGGGLLYRGLSGHCQAYQMLDVDTTEKPKVGDDGETFRGIQVRRVVSIARPASEIYAFLKVPGNHQRIGDYVDSVTTTAEGNWHWKMRGPFGVPFEFDSEIIGDKPDALIAWKSLPGAPMPNAGSIRLAPTADGKGTEVTQEMSYEPPAGKLGATIAKLFPQDPEKIVLETLRHLKQLLEAGEIPTVEGQPSGRA